MLLGVIYLELIDEHGDGVELVVCVWRFSHGVSRGGEAEREMGGGKSKRGALSESNRDG